MLFIVRFTDAEGQEHQRQAYMQAHLAFLEAHTNAIHAAGPLFAPDGQGAGGLWLVEAEDAQAVRRLVERDPFYPTGLRDQIEITRWQQVFREGRRL